jgi:cytoskeleton protein RodZ
MSDATPTLDPDAVTPVGSDASPLTAGQMLKAAREGAGMHIGALSVALKVPVRKLELLEADAHDQLPGATFTRALAKSVCRVLKIDPSPVLAQMPDRQDAGLDHAVIGGVRREAFAAAVNHTKPVSWGSQLPKPVVAAALVLVLAAGGLWLLPPVSSWSLGSMLESPLEPSTNAAKPESGAASAATPPVEVSKPVADPAAAVTVADAAMVSRAPVAALTSAQSVAADAALQLRTTAPSWIEVRDVSGAVLYTGTVLPGVPASVDLKGPAQLVVGNAASTDVIWRGRQLDVASAARDNVARIELK